ncbi:Rieske (2Fe-2S) protein [Aquipuribacter hungaricus]|uniref:Rieske (2Fe-2S) protein n=1 Tax=Aquipuribacter hungaricus TaxID=545624 RepID=A0ABV7WG88_9MICO
MSRERGPLPAPGTVGRIAGWAVGRTRSRATGGTGEPEVFAVSRFCRHQLADMSKGTVDADGCLVCPWHQSRYDVTDGRMVSGPRGFLGYHGPTPGYSAVIKAYGKVLRLRVRKARVVDGEVELG